MWNIIIGIIIGGAGDIANPQPPIVSPNKQIVTYQQIASAPSPYQQTRDHSGN